MLKRKDLTKGQNGNGQVFLEYTLILGVLALVMFGMGPMLKRGVQGLIKFVADQVGVQKNAEQKFDDSGHMESTHISTRSTTRKTTREVLGMTNYMYSDLVETTSNALIDVGFTKE